MNLEGLARTQISAVNPLVPASMQISTGSTTGADGKRTPIYETVTGLAEVQAMSFMDLKQVDGLNLNGTRRGIYFQGAFNGVVRPNQKGGDLVTLTDGPNAGTWLIALVLEQWPDWCKVAVTLQNGA
jgi:hypothetical protein